MVNPLSENAKTAADAAPGVAVVHARDRHGTVIKTILIQRTSRDYVFDLCDAYNAARSADALDRGVEWFVTPAGELKVGIAAAWSRANARQIESRNETERARHNRFELEAARAALRYDPPAQG